MARMTRMVVAPFALLCRAEACSTTMMHQEASVEGPPKPTMTLAATTERPPEQIFSDTTVKSLAKTATINNGKVGIASSVEKLPHLQVELRTVAC